MTDQLVPATHSVPISATDYAMGLLRLFSHYHKDWTLEQMAKEIDKPVSFIEEYLGPKVLTELRERK